MQRDPRQMVTYFLDAFCGTGHFSAQGSEGEIQGRCCRRQSSLQCRQDSGAGIFRQGAAEQFRDYWQVWACMQCHANIRTRTHARGITHGYAECSHTRTRTTTHIRTRACTRAPSASPACPLVPWLLCSMAIGKVQQMNALRMYISIHKVHGLGFRV